MARALARQPDFIIFDEPTAGLDAHSAEEIARLMRDVHDQANGQRSTWIITHDLEAFQAVADGALMMNPGAGSMRLLEGEAMESFLEEARGLLQKKAVLNPLTPLRPSSRIGGFLSLVLLQVASLSLLLLATIRTLIPYHLGMVFRSVLELSLRPAPYIALTAATAGGLATTFAIDNNPLEGAFQRETLLGTGKVLVGAALPLLAGILFAARASAGEAARIGGLRRSRVFEALPFLGISPHAFLLNPLLLGAIVGSVVLSGLAIVSGCLAAFLVARLEIGVSAYSWASASFAAVNGSDFQWGFLKAIASGAVTALVAYHLASKPKQSQRDVADATTGAIVWSTLWVLILHGFMTITQYSD